MSDLLSLTEIQRSARMRMNSKSCMRYGGRQSTAEDTWIILFR